MVLPVAVTRLCPDCDVFTESEICPACGRNRTVPVATWLRPLRAAHAPTAGRPPARMRRPLLRQRAPTRSAPARVAS